VIEASNTGAVISEDGQYRYRLWRHFTLPAKPGHEAPSRQRVLWIMLNPSTANAEVNDPTIRKCLGFTAYNFGYGGIEVVNLYAYRAAKPKVLWESRKTVDIVGPENDDYIARALKDEHIGKVVVAWGASGGDWVQSRVLAVMLAILQSGHQPECLGVTKAGDPRHPLMVSYDTPLMRFDR
jgi:hypothetical protein